MKLNRRTVLTGVGTAAAGIAAVFSTGAFVQQQVSREFIVSITNDEDEAVQLPISANSNLDLNSRVQLQPNADGVDVLTVDATNLPTNSTVTIGDFSNVDDSSSLNAGAFTVTNNNALDGTIDLTISLGSAANSTVELAVTDDGGSTVSTVTDSTSQAFTLDTNEAVEVGVWISTTDTTGTETVDITIEATEA